MSSIYQGKPRQPSAQEQLVGKTLRDGEYKIDAILGQGGMGCVFLASHMTLNVPLAIKQCKADAPIPDIVIAELNHILYGKEMLRRTSQQRLSEQDFPTSGGMHTDRFLREALLLSRLQHPALPGLYDYFFEDGYWYLVMDYIPGPTLGVYLYKRAPLPPLEALNYAMQLCDVLDYLHKQTPPVIFRDLKPANIILSPPGRVMLVDFGIARYYKEGQMNDTTEFGSPGYAPPEQYKGEGQTDARSDLYSLGVILHEMLSGQRPERESEHFESLHLLNPALSSVLSGLVTVATRAEPMYRFQSAYIFYQALVRTYAIEERRAYQHCLQAEYNEAASSESAGEQAKEAQNIPVQEASTILRSASIPLPSRANSHREELQKALRQRIEHERLEKQMATVDESLKRRSTIGLTPMPEPVAEDVELPYRFDTKEIRHHDSIFLAERHPSASRRIIQTCLLLSLLVLLLPLSWLTYNRYLVHTQAQAAPTPISAGRTALPTGAPTHPINTAGATAVAGVTQSSWEILPSLPSPEADNTASYVQLQGKPYIYVSAGYRGPKVTPHYDRGLYRYDITAAHWEKLVLPQFPGMVNNAVAQDEQHHLFFTVGYSPDVYAIQSLLYMYQPENNSLQKIVPPASVQLGFGGSMVADQQGHLYLTQGFMQSGNPHTLAGTGWYEYDIQQGTWQTLAPLPVGLGYVVLTVDTNGNILLIGGSKDAGQTQPTTQLYRYDRIQNAWQLTSTPAPVAVSGATGCLNGQGQLVLIGGFDPVHNTTLNQVWQLNLQTLNWVPLAHLPSGGSLLGTAASDGQGHIYLVRGANDPARPTPDFWELTIGQ